MQPTVPVLEKKASKLLALKTLWRLRQWEKLPVSQESRLEGATDPKMYKKSPPTQESAPEGHNSFVSSKGSD